MLEVDSKFTTTKASRLSWNIVSVREIYIARNTSRTSLFEIYITEEYILIRYDILIMKFVKI